MDNPPKIKPDSLKLFQFIGMFHTVDCRVILKRNFLSTMSSLDDSIQQLPNAIPHATSQPQPEVPIGKQIQEAIRQSQEQRIVKYEEVAIISCCWRGDDTGAEQDCNLFVETMKKIQSDSCTVKASIHMINVSDRITSLLEDCVTARQQLDPAKRSLFVFHYAGHGKTNNSGDLLGLAPNGPGADPPIETRQLSDIISRLELASREIPNWMFCVSWIVVMLRLEDRAL